ncbi:MAG: hypothetical protein ACYDDA_06610 [Acidiferrobacteraceae bacterium]
MKLNDLLQYLHLQSGHDLLDGSAEETIRKALAGTHRDPLAGEIVSLLYRGPGCTAPDSEITRAQAALALGPLRLRYMKDDAPVEGFRRVEHTVHAIDGAYNDEALRSRSAQK